MIGGFEPKSHYEGEYVPCPECGEPMRYTSKLCHDCHVETLGQIAPAERAARKERQELWDLARAAGWPLDQLYGGKFDPDEPKKDRLPSRTEIVNRMIEQWWKQEVFVSKRQQVKVWLCQQKAGKLVRNSHRGGLRREIKTDIGMSVSCSTIGAALRELRNEGLARISWGSTKNVRWRITDISKSHKVDCRT